MNKTPDIHNSMPGYWWVQTDGYHLKQSLLFLNADRRWRIEVNDKTLFVSTSTLQRMFGKSCILRPLDISMDADTIPDVPKNHFAPYLIKADVTGEPAVLMINVAARVAMLNGMLIPVSSLPPIQSALRYHPLN